MTEQLKTYIAADPCKSMLKNYVSESSITEADTKSSTTSNSPEFKRPDKLQDMSKVPILNSPSSDTTRSGTLESSSFDSLDASTKDASLSVLCSGLLRLLTEALIVLPDPLLDKVVRIVLKPETLIVLAHHESADIRANVVKVCLNKIQSSISN